MLQYIDFPSYTSSGTQLKIIALWNEALFKRVRDMNAVL